MKRQLPKWRDLAPLLKFKRPIWSAKERRLTKALTIEDLRRIAKRRTPKAAFDYTDGAADGEVSLARAREAFGDVEFRPAILRDVSKVDTSRVVLGQRVELPFGIAPTGFTRMMHAEGEIAGATAAAAAGIPFALSTMGTTSIEDVAAANPHGRNWFQLYMWKDRDRSMALVDRAAQAGFDTLLVTVDVPVAGARLRDVRNGMTIPPTLSAAHGRERDPAAGLVVQLPDHRAAGLCLARLVVGHRGRSAGHDVRPDGDLRRPGLDQGPVARQGRGQGRADRRRRAAVCRGRASMRCCCRTTAAASSTAHRCRSTCCPTWWRPSATTSRCTSTPASCAGQDIVAAIAHGAHFTLIGRAYLYGLMSGGREGVDRTIEILRGQIERTMRLLGVTTLDELQPEHVVMLRRLRP